MDAPPAAAGSIPAATSLVIADPAERLRDANGAPQRRSMTEAEYKLGLGYLEMVDLGKNKEAKEACASDYDAGRFPLKWASFGKESSDYSRVPVGNHDDLPNHDLLHSGNSHKLTFKKKEDRRLVQQFLRATFLTTTTTTRQPRLDQYVRLLFLTATYSIYRKILQCLYKSLEAAASSAIVEGLRALVDASCYPSFCLVSVSVL